MNRAVSIVQSVLKKKRKAEGDLEDVLVVVEPASELRRLLVAKSSTIQYTPETNRWRHRTSPPATATI
jgi:hypothetical protein